MVSKASEKLDEARKFIDVLILVLVEDGLEEKEYTGHLAITLIDGLNPCFSGRWSRRFLDMVNFFDKDVLILVLVEDGLEGQNL